jgi:hypothetical protein
VVGFLICAVLVILVGDILYSRARLRLRANAMHGAARRPHELTAGASHCGWRSSDGRNEPDLQGDNPFDRVLGGNSQRNSRRRPR